MEIDEFLKKFLPDYKQKQEEMNLTFAERLWFYEKYFPEVLQSFADRICAKQRELCAETQGDFLTIFNQIINAPQPKFE